ncbi:MAG: filamentous hemagglutinin N-terminal domain-containing protein [Gammaproteobacteria bacterium]|nr:filamentous hemagglutinin N-terminal domain-containing protein [Gammaproteobacteria bacterium]
MKKFNKNLLAISVINSLCMLTAQANPTGMDVVRGNVAISRPSSTALHITNSPNAIINWKDFSIKSGETTRFIQENARSSVLNRVTSQSPSAIMGNLQSNGKVFLINPNGIVFGANSRVDTAGLIASTLEMSNKDFLAGQYSFSGDSGSIVNHGYIRSGKDGEVVFISPNIENSGIIEAEDGQILLAAGRDITLTSLDSEGVNLKVTAPDDEILNLGQLIADKGAIGLFADQIKQQGRIQANALVRGADGKIRLVAKTKVETSKNSVTTANNGDIKIQSQGVTKASGVIAAKGDEQGGKIQVLGNTVRLEEAKIDASGKTGGGEVLIGGDYKGQGTTQTAQNTLFDKNSEIKADAIDEGDGGKVIVWANGVTFAKGKISAKGGQTSGDGGFV